MTDPNPLARDPRAIAMFRERVNQRNWDGALRMALVLGFHRTAPPVIGERPAEYLSRLAERFANVA